MKLNNDGFTLVELLATIVVLGIISVISIISVDNMIDHSQVTECETILLSIKNSAKEYVSEHRFDKNKAELERIDAEFLIKNGYLTSEIKNPFDKKLITAANLKVYITLNDDYTYKSSVIKNTSGKIITCSEDVKEGYVRFPG